MPALDELHAATIRDLDAAFAEIGVIGVIIGGVAVSLLASPRYTADVDSLLLYDTSEVDDLVCELERHNFRPAFSGMVDVAKQARVVAVVHATGIRVDIALGCLPFEEELVRRAEVHDVSGLGVRLPTLEDLVIMKAIASRPKDLEDIRSIAAVHPDLDRARIRRWVTQYGELLDTPDLWSQIEPLIVSP